MSDLNKIPRSADDDYSPEIVEQRQQFIEQKPARNSIPPSKFSFDPPEMETTSRTSGRSQGPGRVAGCFLKRKPVPGGF
ncbi:MAG: hypothetical protein CM15mP89_4660 [Gammaproteobacteria bacterium]|nr:MAG: hypothetical protein CM15mP89_4660 [Gammaproteobacteria bacterium]